MKPGSRADREEMVRILVEDLKASVRVLDMHDYRKGVVIFTFSIERCWSARAVNRSLCIKSLTVLCTNRLKLTICVHFYLEQVECEQRKPGGSQRRRLFAFTKTVPPYT